jgi:hypothetical protein
MSHFGRILRSDSVGTNNYAQYLLKERRSNQLPERKQNTEKEEE